MNILITGASGLIGSALSPYLVQRGHHVFKLGRYKRAPTDLVWDPPKGIIELPDAITFDAVINLAGENIAEGRWTARKKERIRSSRIDSTNLLIHTILARNPKPKALFSASGIGIYGDRGDNIITESDPTGNSFLIDVCREWEEATQPAEKEGIRVCHLRIAPVFTLNGGMLKRMLPAFKIGFGTTMGNGSQYMSWITTADLIRAIEFLLYTNSLEGPVNLCTSNAVTNLEFTRTLGKSLHRPAILKIPGPMLRMLFGEVADSELLSSTRATPGKLINAGFEFEYPELEKALIHLFGATDE